MKKESLKSRDIAEADYLEFMQLYHDKKELLFRLQNINERIIRLENKLKGDENNG